MSSSSFRALRLWGVPVEISIWFFAVVLFLGMSASSAVGGLVWIAALTVSVLAHELGHALAARRYGLGPRIILHGWGGLCQHAPARSERQDLTILVAGPATEIALGLAAFLLLDVLASAAPALGRAAPIVPWFLDSLGWVSVIWGGANLLPIWPLDGGQIAFTLLQRRRPLGQAHQLVHNTGMILAGLVAVWGLLTHHPFAALLGGLLAWQNYRALRQPPRRRAGPWAPSSSGASPAPLGGGSLRPTPAVRLLLLTLAGLWAALLVLASFGATAGVAAWVYDELALTPGDTLAGLHLWQLATYMVLHDPQGLGHIVGNLLALWFLGPVLERRWGARDFLQFFVLAGVGAAAWSLLAAYLLPSLFWEPVIGASGALVGLVAAISLTMPRAELWLLIGGRLEARWLIWIVLGLDTLALVTGLVPDMAWHTHVGGAITAWFLITGSWRPRVFVDRVRLLWLRRGRRRPPLRAVPGGKRRPLH